MSNDYTGDKDKLYVVVRKIEEGDSYNKVAPGYELVVSDDVGSLPSAEDDDRVVSDITPQDSSDNESDLWPRGPWTGRTGKGRAVDVRYL